MIFTPEERRALLVLGTVLAFGQALAWIEDWRVHAPDRELATWLDQVRQVRAEADSTSAEPGTIAAHPNHVAADPRDLAAHPNPVAAHPNPVAADPRDLAAHPGAAAADRNPAAADPGAAAADPNPRAAWSRPEEVREDPLSSLPPGILESGRIRIDLASAEELTTLPGIGPALAARIIAARAEAPFRAVDDLLRVKGIGQKTLERLRDHVSVQSPRADADSSRGEQHVDAAESRRRSEAGAGGPHQ